jgi:hypothetical protein
MGNYYGKEGRQELAKPLSITLEDISGMTYDQARQVAQQTEARGGSQAAIDSLFEQRERIPENLRNFRIISLNQDGMGSNYSYIQFNPGDQDWDKGSIDGVMAGTKFEASARLLKDFK